MAPLIEELNATRTRTQLRLVYEMATDSPLAWHPIPADRPWNYTDEERREFAALLDSGLIDIYAHLYPNGHDRFTYWNYASNRDEMRYGVRLDLILGTKSVVDRVHNIRVDMDYRRQIGELRPSESAPVIAELHD